MRSSGNAVGMGSSRFFDIRTGLPRGFLGLSDDCRVTPKHVTKLLFTKPHPVTVICLSAIFSISHLTEIEWLDNLCIYTAANLFVSKIHASLAFCPFILRLFFLLNLLAPELFF